MDCLSPINHKGIYRFCRELENHSWKWWAPQLTHIIWKSLTSISIALFGDIPLNSLWGSEKLSCSTALPQVVGNPGPQCWVRWFISCNHLHCHNRKRLKTGHTHAPAQRNHKALIFYVLLLKTGYINSLCEYGTVKGIYIMRDKAIFPRDTGSLWACQELASEIQNEWSTWDCSLLDQFSITKTQSENGKESHVSQKAGLIQRCTNTGKWFSTLGSAPGLSFMWKSQRFPCFVPLCTYQSHNIHQVRLALMSSAQWLTSPPNVLQFHSHRVPDLPSFRQGSLQKCTLTFCQAAWGYPQSLSKVHWAGTQHGNKVVTQKSALFCQLLLKNCIQQKSSWRGSIKTVSKKRFQLHFFFWEGTGNNVWNQCKQHTAMCLPSYTDASPPAYPTELYVLHVLGGPNLNAQLETVVCCSLWHLPIHFKLI